jgi:Plasma-membrane choline transporter.
MFGYNFCRGGQQAFKHLSSNVLQVSAINSVGDFVLFLGKALVVVATILIGFKMFDVSYQHFVLKLLILCHINAEKLNIPCSISHCIKSECCGRTTI